MWASRRECGVPSHVAGPWRQPSRYGFTLIRGGGRAPPRGCPADRRAAAAMLPPAPFPIRAVPALLDADLAEWDRLPAGEREHGRGRLQPLPRIGGIDPPRIDPAGRERPAALV